MINEKSWFNDLETIADWQLNADKAQVVLPELQRGYVWKPKQVETLWDSLLRGFPIGSFLLLENVEKSELLDGQQRATAVAMGFYNPWEDSQSLNFFEKKFKTHQKSVPVLWLDLGVKADVANGEKGDFIFLPRLITQSHPWGYNRNGDVLSISFRKNAKNKFNNSGFNYPQYNLKNVYPWIAELPIPMCFLIGAIRTGKNWKAVLIEKCREYLFKNEVKSSDEIAAYYTKLEEILNDDDTFKNVETTIRELLQIKIPIISLKRNQFERESDTAREDASTLFVRVNTAGTRLDGEELIYSMYKSLFPKAKQIVEEAGAGFIAPSRIITLISRIILTDISKNNQDFKFANQLKFKEFKNKIQDKEGDFYKGIKQFSEEKNDSVEVLFNKVKCILIGEKDFQLPFPLAVDIARGNTDIFFILLYWIHTSKINVGDITNDEQFHKKILAAITTLSWFGLDTKGFLNELAKSESDSLKIDFWHSELYKKVQSLEYDDNNRWITSILHPDELKGILNKKFNNNWEDILGSKKQLFDQFKNKLFGQKGLLLFAQRNYMNDRFKDLFLWDTLIEDANRPWDWDHIYPSVYNQKGTYDEIRQSNYNIGNLRAWALEDNRSDQANLPKVKIREVEKKSSFIEPNDWFFWEKIDAERITTNENKAKNVCLAIYTRLSNIYGEWYNTLNVGELINHKDYLLKESMNSKDL